MSNVVADGLRAEVQLLGNLRGGAAALEELEHLALTRREVQIRVSVRLLDDLGDLSEHSYHMLTTNHGHRADFDRDALAVGVDDCNARVSDPLRADDLAR